ncbi:hypothetical protein KR009_003911 [Drosophila setifemur]|nr:hypothetical protein KR009_003911 [Drosophila setifemur]
MENYTHKKFNGALKRKRSQDSESDDDVVFVMERTPEQPPAKRPFFRPWMNESPEVLESDQSQPTRNSTPPQVDTTYHPNMVRNQTRRQRSPQEQMRRDRNTLASLRHRRSQQQKQKLIEQQYLTSRIQHEANLQQQIRLSLYYVRFLQQTMASIEPLGPVQHHQMPNLAQVQPTTTQQP